MIHERLDITHWKTVFSLSRLRAEARASRQRDPDVGGSSITGPADIVLLEQAREEAFAGLPELERVPTDVFVWNRGEPARREVTKIGGLPYRAAGKPWPKTISGTPLTFVAQFCFGDSRDIAPKLPGDLLLIFTLGVETRYENEVTYYPALDNAENEDFDTIFEWVNLGDFPLTTRTELPQTGWKILPCYGTIYRTCDYPTIDGFAYPHIADYIPPIVGGTKIGGLCPPLVGEEDIPGEFLCALGSVFPDVGKPFPFLNEPVPLTYEERQNSDLLMIGDVGELYFFINSYGDLRWTTQGG
jgi:hypothetical protein